MKNTIILLLVMLCQPAIGQLAPYQWRLGVSGGYTNYYGDLSPYRINAINSWEGLGHLFHYNTNYQQDFSYQISLERRLNKTIGFQLNAGRYQFTMEDRYVQSGGKLFTEAPQFARSLNVQTEIRDLGVSLVFKTDNGRFLSSRSFLAPYFNVGVGLLWFNNSADLKNDQDEFYDYSQSEVVRNGIFETPLNGLKTEGVDYTTRAYYAQLGLGIRFRLSYQWEIGVQSDFRLAFTDYLDDISGNYYDNYTSSEQAFAANPNNQSGKRGSSNPYDMYIFHGINLKFSFKQKKQSFVAPKVIGHGVALLDSSRNSGFDILLAEKIREEQATKEKGISTNQELITAKTETIAPIQKFEFNLQYIAQEDTLFKIQTSERLFQAEKELALLRSQNELSEKNNLLKWNDIQLENLTNEIENLKNDTSLAPDEKEKKLKALQETQKKWKDEKTAIEKEKNTLESQIKNIQNQEFVYQRSSSRPDTFMLSRILDSLIFENQDIQANQSTYCTQKNTKSTHTSESKTIKTNTFEDSLIDIRIERLMSQLPQDKENRTLVEKEIYALKTELRNLKQTNDSLLQVQAMPQQRTSFNNEDEMAELRNEIENLKNKQNSTQITTTSIPSGKSKTKVNVKSDETLLKEFNQQMELQNKLLTALLMSDLLKNTVEDRTKENTKWADQDSTHKQIIVESTSDSSTQTNENRIDPELNRLLEMLDKREELLQKQDTSKEETNNTARSIIEQQENDTEQKEEKPQEIVETGTVFIKSSSLFFKPNQVQLNHTDTTEMNKVAQYLKQNPERKVRLISYADNTGDVQYNLNLCKQRAQSVQKELILCGIDQSRISIHIGGQIVRQEKSKSNDSDRRVDIKIE